MNNIHVIVDRPLGTYHPKHIDLYYPVNYGYIEGIMAGDGEEQDAYILGIDEPVKEFDGELYAIVHRINDVEDKWIVVPQGYQISKEQIEDAIDFQEQYFQHILLFINQPIRLAEINDLSRITEILVFTKRYCYRGIFDNQYLFQELQVLKLYQNYIHNPSLRRHLFVYDDGIIKGMMNVMVTKEYLELKELYVDVIFQKQHIGHHLLLFFFSIAKQLHISYLQLWVIEKNMNAIHFYSQHGFVVEGQKERIGQTDQYQILMIKEI
ncbi:GNAT family N-acetyltransferase [Candidatus Stoquefichus massiliensis]|uniref:GNAT family N-acetyltransferase n=1 Tax=Candidatus Stoquefichus massiliensis TaxID=1470350 RepID=UPI0004B216A4|nr:GNAT family N-acetyltransferase [Candidatus Stoquefichus massiliensis]